ncbi:MAG: DMT family transporter [Saprospiraceae bacterium]|jgi:drug/metabolite transporter (DMT)-like permease|nr:DMT family transporter [Saprospiraceae bacterium]
MNDALHRTSYIKIHIAVILFGFTAILGDLIQLPAISIVWWRVLITSISLFFLISLGKKLKNLSAKQIKIYIIIGIIIGLHWICFYGSVKLANASVCLICMSTTSLFTSVIEPFWARTKFNKLNLFMGFLVIPGMLLVVNNIDVQYMAGVWVGLASAFLAAVFSTLNKAYIKEADPYTISFIELSGAWMMITILQVVIHFAGFSTGDLMPPSLSDWLYLILLALLCTTLAQVLTLQALKHLSAFALNLVVNLEPVYGILLAAFILKEHKELNLMFYTGAAIIVMTVILYPLLNKKFNLKNH